VTAFVRGGWIQRGLETAPGGQQQNYGEDVLAALGWIRSVTGIPFIHANTIVRDPVSQAAWLVEDDGFRHWIPTGTDYNCFITQGKSLVNENIWQIKSIPEDYTDHATCTPGGGGGGGGGGGPTVTVSKGAPHTVPGCTSSACAYVTVTLSGFGGGSHIVSCSSDDPYPPGSPWYTYTTSSTVSNVCVYGYPGYDVWVNVDGVESNHLTW